MMKHLSLFIILISIGSCIDRFDFNIPDSDLQLVVDGRITDAPGPYTVKITRTQKLNNLLFPPTVSAKAVTIFDNVGNSETLTEIKAGIYQTSPTGIRGVIGRVYTLRIETFDNKIYESSPEKINPAGTVDSIYYEFQKNVSLEGVSGYQFKIFMNSRGEPQGDNHFLWKLTGTYKVITSPELHIILTQRLNDPPPPPKKDPRVCSGYVYNPRTDQLDYVKPCECCTCWASLVDSKPHVSDNNIVANGQFNKVDMGAIPVDFWPFWDKTMVKVEQLSLSNAAFNYWKAVRDQQEGAVSLFQPAISKAVSNIFLKNGKEEVQGLFQASAISKNFIFLSAKDIPLGSGIIPPPPSLPPRYIPTPGLVYEEFLSEPFVVREACTGAFAHSTTQQPIDWK